MVVLMVVLMAALTVEALMAAAALMAALMAADGVLMAALTEAVLMVEALMGLAAQQGQSYLIQLHHHLLNHHYPEPPCPRCECDGTLEKVITIIHEGSGGPGVTLDSTLTDEVCRGLTTDSQGNIICVGHTNGSLFEEAGGGEDIIVFKATSTGSLIWLKQIGETTKTNTESILTTDGDDVCLDVVTDSSGNLLWDILPLASLLMEI